MADRTITAEAIISGRDLTGDLFAQIARKANGVGKSISSVSPAIEGMAKSVMKAQEQLKALDRMAASQKGMASARANFNSARDAVLNASRAMQSGAGPAKQLAANYASAQRAVSQASAAFDKQKTAAIAAKRALESFGTPIGRMVAEQAKLRSVIDSTTKAIDRQNASENRLAHSTAGARRVATTAAEQRAAERRLDGVRHHGIVNYALGAGAGYVGAHGVMRGVHYSLEKGADRQHARVSALNAGIPVEEVERMEKAAIAARGGAPLMSTSQIMELHKEARSAVQHPEEAFHLIPDLAQAASVLKGMGAKGANIADIVKGGESLGLMNDPKRFHRYLEGQVKAMAVMGKTIDTTQVYEAAKYSKSAGAALSDDFINLTLPSLIQEMHGSSAGDALSMMTKTFRGGLQHKHLPVERLNEIGLLEDPSKIRRNKAGTIMGYKGKLKGDDLLASAPDRWAWEVFNPAAEKSGVSNIADKVKLLSEVLPSTAANLMRIFLQQEQTLKQHRKNYEAAPSLGGMAENQGKDPKAGMNAIRASLDDLASSVTGPGMLNAAKGISSLANGIRALSAAAENHPKTAMTTGAVVAGGALGGAGYMAYQLSQGFGLRTSAVALDGAAGQLTRAAIALQGGKMPNGMPGVAPNPGAGLASKVPSALSFGGLSAIGLPFALIGGLSYLAAGKDQPEEVVRARAEMAELTKRMNTLDQILGGGRGNAQTQGKRDAAQKRFNELKTFVANDGRTPQADAAERERQRAVRQLGLNATPEFTHPGMPGFQYRGAGKRAGWDMSQIPMAPIASAPSALPTFAAGPLGARFPGAGELSKQTIDVTGKVGAEVTSHVDAKVQVTISAPAGITATVTNQTVVTKPGVGRSMPGAAVGGGKIDGYL